MIVPRTRLLGAIALVVTPSAAVAALVPGSGALAATVVGLLFILAVVDGVTARKRLEGVSIELPELVRLQKGREGSVNVRVRNATRAPRTIRIALPWPEELFVAKESQRVLLPRGADAAQMEWSVTARKRGRFRIDRAYFETPSTLGFWNARRSSAAALELRAYPDLRTERSSVAAIFLRRAGAGTRVQRQAGQGREFEKLREYMHGDSIEDVHWKASAKRGHLVTKIFQVERAQEVYVIVDASRLTAREMAGSPVPRFESSDSPGDAAGALTASTTALERFVTAALVLGVAAEQQGDQFGLITFSDRVLSFARAKSGQAHYDVCRERLFALQPQMVSPDFDELCSFIRVRLRKRALLIFLTALDDPLLAETFLGSVDLICRQHLVLVNMLTPAGAAPLFSDADVRDVDDIYRRLGGHLRWRQLRELEKVLQRRGVQFSLLDPAKLSAQILAHHAEVKARQLV